MSHKIDLRLGPAVDTLDELIQQGQKGSFDFAFIDADKVNYTAYYEKCLQLIASGGVIAIDNVLWGGSVLDSKRNDEDTKAIRELNDFVASDERVNISMIPIGDGVTLVVKK